jgi:8-oxo-dGTP diphosphatase
VLTARRGGEAEWLRDYDARAYPPFALTVDLAIFTIRAGRLCALLVRRGEHPYRGWWALPGGHVQHGRESAGQAAARELTEETGIDPQTSGAHLEQLATYSDPRRDPRIGAGLHVATVAYVALAPDLPEPTAGTDAAAARWSPVSDLPARLAFDHAGILGDALDRVRAKLEYSTLALNFVTEPFSLSDLHRVYGAVWGSAPDFANFRRKVLATPGFVEPIAPSGRPATPSGGRPPVLYRRGRAVLIAPPITRPVSE